MPSLHPGFGEWLSKKGARTVAPGYSDEADSSSYVAIPTKVGGTNHTKEFANSAALPEAHKACLNVSIALAALGVKVLVDDEFFAEVCGRHELEH